MLCCRKLLGAKTCVHVNAGRNLNQSREITERKCGTPTQGFCASVDEPSFQHASLGFKESEATNEVDWQEESVITRHLQVLESTRETSESTYIKPPRRAAAYNTKRLKRRGILPSAEAGPKTWSPCSYIMLGRGRRGQEIARPLLLRWTRCETRLKYRT